MVVETHQAEKIWTYDRTTVRPTVQGATLTCVVNCTAGTPTPRPCPVVQWSVHWAPSRTTRVLVLAGARRCALGTCRKKNVSSAFRLGLIYILSTYQRLSDREKICHVAWKLLTMTPQITNTKTTPMSSPDSYYCARNCLVELHKLPLSASYNILSCCLDG